MSHNGISFLFVLSSVTKSKTTAFVETLASAAVTSSNIGGGGGAIWLGEHHNSRKDHDFQAEFIRQIHDVRQKNPKSQGDSQMASSPPSPPPMAIGLEQVQKQFQYVLDDYINGKISLDELKQNVEWDKRWMWDFNGYQEIFETAKQLNIKLLALNVDTEDLVLVEKDGYPGLPLHRLRKYIIDPIGFGSFAKTKEFSTYVDYVISPSYDIHDQLGLLQTTMTGERLEEKMSFRNFLSGRILWDESMASTSYTWVKQNPNGLLIGLVGADHVKFTNGIPGRFARMSEKDGGPTCSTIIINPTLIDSRPSGSVANIAGSDLSNTPDKITLQLRYLKDGVDTTNVEERKLPASTGGVMPFADFIVVT